MESYKLKNIVLDETKLDVTVQIVLELDPDVLQPKASISFVAQNYTRRLPLKLVDYIADKKNNLAVLTFFYSYNLFFLWEDIDTFKDFDVLVNVNYGNYLRSDIPFDTVGNINTLNGKLYSITKQSDRISISPKEQAHIEAKKLLKHRKQREFKSFREAFFEVFFAKLGFLLYPFKWVYKKLAKFFAPVVEVFKFKKRLKKEIKNMRPMFLKIINLYSRFVKVDPNLVIFLSESRSELSGNFEYVYNELKNVEGITIRSYVKNVTEPHSRKFRNNRIKDIARAKVILLDDFYPPIYKRYLKPEQQVIQLWHACGAFKTFGFSRLGKKGGPPQTSKNHRNYTGAIVSSTEIAPFYAEAFGIPVHNVRATGVPRTDIFFDEAYKAQKQEEFFDEFPHAKGKKIIMFAPTFRGNGKNSAHYPLDTIRLESLYGLLEDDYFFIFKMHPFIKNKVKIPAHLKSFAVDLSSEREINDLLFVTDVLITDYSSVIFEASLLNIPMLFYAYDLEEYVATRDFYYDFKAMVPGSIYDNFDELALAIYFETYDTSKIESFKKRFFDDLDGQSTTRVVQYIQEKLEE